MGQGQTIHSSFEREVIQSIFEGVVSGPGNEDESLTIVKIVVQLMYHMKPFRVPFMSIPESQHKHTPDCAFCPVHALFTQLQFGESGNLDHAQIRANLHETFEGGDEDSNTKKISLGELKHASEAFEALVKKLQKNLAVQTFSYDVRDGYECDVCSHEGPAKPYHPRVWYVSGPEMIQMIEKRRGRKKYTFEEVVLECCEHDAGQAKPCPNPECSSGGRRACFLAHHTVTKLPFVITLAIQWKEGELRATSKRGQRKLRRTTAELLRTFAPVILPDEMFRMGAAASDLAGRLIGFVAYSERSHLAYHWDTEVGLWFKVDDDEVEPVGKKWRDVANSMIHLNAFPTLMFFELVRRQHDVIHLDELDD